jgi:hypothetical protein
MFQTVAGRISFPGKEISRKCFFKEIPWDRVETTRSPWMAAGDPFSGEPASGQWAVKAQGIRRIERAGWKMATAAG